MRRMTGTFQSLWKPTSCEPSFEETTEELPDGISPKLIAFLDADSDEERYTILNEMEDIVDDHMMIRWRLYGPCH